MFDPSWFVNPALAAAGLSLIAVPIVIHLINLMRHRRVEWAAMEFLLESQKKNSTYVMLKQLLLLLLRMLAIAAVALIVGQLMLKDVFSSSETHHLVILQDDLSTGEQQSASGETALDRGKQVVERIVGTAAEQSSQKFTLLRTSDRQPIFQQEDVKQDFPQQRLKDELAKLKPAAVSRNPVETLQLADQILGEPQGSRRIVYLVSDFRERDFQASADLRQALQKIKDDNTELVFVRTTDELPKNNLAVTRLRTTNTALVSEVPFVVEVTIKNFGSEPATNVVVNVEEDGQARPDRPGFAIIPPGEEKTYSFVSQFTTAGEHIIKANLAGDAVMADNERHLVLNLKPTIDVLLVDGDTGGPEAETVAAALDPSPSQKFYYSPRRESPGFLQDADLSQFGSVFLFNITALNQTAIDNLENYVRSGGGLCIFCGPETDSTLVNTRLYRDGEGVFPLPLAVPTPLLRESTEFVPDLQPTEHPIFAGWYQEPNSVLDAARFFYYWRPAASWSVGEDRSVSIVSRFRNNDPFAVEKTFGDGRVMVYLTAAASDLASGRAVWTDWHRENPSFPISMFETTHYLLKQQGVATDERLVGQVIRDVMPQDEFSQQVALVSPEDADTKEVVQAKPLEEEDPVTGQKQALWSYEFATKQPGVYQVLRNEVSDAGAEQDARLYAVNVDTGESNLRVIGQEDLYKELEGVDYQFQTSDGFAAIDSRAAQQNLSEAILYILVALLLAEQVLAYLLSYHPAKSDGGSAA